MSETQQISLVIVEAMKACDPEKVFAETLCLVSTATARAAVAAFASVGRPSTNLSETLLALPITLHSYVAGGEVLRSGAESQADVSVDTTDLEHMLHFYGTHLADSGLPDRKALHHVMLLWMGRISPPGLNEHPEQRLERLELVDRLGVHVRLVEAFARNAAQTDS